MDTAVLEPVAKPLLTSHCLRFHRLSHFPPKALVGECGALWEANSRSSQVAPHGRSAGQGPSETGR